MAMKDFIMKNQFISENQFIVKYFITEKQVISVKDCAPLPMRPNHA